LPPLLLGLDERGQAPLPDLFYFLHSNPIVPILRFKFY